MMKIERYFLNTDVTTEEADGSPGKLRGRVTTWDTVSHDRGGYKVIFRQGAFSNVENPHPIHDIKAYRDHNEDIYLGRLSNGTLKIAETEDGIDFELTLPDTQDGRDTAALVKRQDIKGMSFGYIPEEWEWQAGPTLIHKSGFLVEVSPVFDPSFPNTEVGMYSLGEPDEKVLDSLKDYLGTPKRNSAKRRLRLAENELVLS